MFSSTGYSNRTRIVWRIDAEYLGSFISTCTATDGREHLVGRSVFFENGTLGVLSGALWNNGWDYENFNRNYFLVGQTYESRSLTPTILIKPSHDIRLSGVLITQFEHDRGDELYTATLLNVLLLPLRPMRGIIVMWQRYSSDAHWLARAALFFQQLRGEHPLGVDGQYGLNWYYAFAQAGRQEPDRREFRYDLELKTDDWYLSDRPEGNLIFYSTLSDRNHDGSVQLNRKR